MYSTQAWYRNEWDPLSTLNVAYILMCEKDIIYGLVNDKWREHINKEI